MFLHAGNGYVEVSRSLHLEFHHIQLIRNENGVPNGREIQVDRSESDGTGVGRR